MRPKDLPERWESRIAEWIRARRSKHLENLGAGDFPCGESLHLRFPDGSNATFRHAFFIEAPELNEIGVFTEHCFYHIFPLVDTQISRAEDAPFSDAED